MHVHFATAVLMSQYLFPIIWMAFPPTKRTRQWIRRRCSFLYTFHLSQQHHNQTFVRYQTVSFSTKICLKKLHSGNPHTDILLWLLVTSDSHSHPFSAPPLPVRCGVFPFESPSLNLNERLFCDRWNLNRTLEPRTERSRAYPKASSVCFFSLKLRNGNRSNFW